MDAATWWRPGSEADSVMGGARIAMRSQAGAPATCEAAGVESPIHLKRFGPLRCGRCHAAFEARPAATHSQLGSRRGAVRPRPVGPSGCWGSQTASGSEHCLQERTHQASRRWAQRAFRCTLSFKQSCGAAWGSSFPTRFRPRAPLPGWRRICPGSSASIRIRCATPLLASGLSGVVVYPPFSRSSVTLRSSRRSAMRG